MPIADFLSKERRLSPILIFFALVAAGSLVGMAGIVAPSDPRALTAQSASSGSCTGTAESSSSAKVSEGADIEKCKPGHAYRIHIDSSGKSNVIDDGAFLDCEAKDKNCNLINKDEELGFPQVGCPNSGIKKIGYGQLTYSILTQTAPKIVRCYPGEDPEAVALAIAYRDNPTLRDEISSTLADSPKSQTVEDSLRALEQENRQVALQARDALDSCYELGCSAAPGIRDYVDRENQKWQTSLEALESYTESTEKFDYAADTIVYGDEPTGPLAPSGGTTASYYDEYGHGPSNPAGSGDFGQYRAPETGNTVSGFADWVEPDPIFGQKNWAWKAGDVASNDGTSGDIVQWDKSVGGWMSYDLANAALEPGVQTQTGSWWGSEARPDPVGEDLYASATLDDLATGREVRVGNQMYEFGGGGEMFVYTETPNGVVEHIYTEKTVQEIGNYADVRADAQLRATDYVNSGLTPPYTSEGPGSNANGDASGEGIPLGRPSTGGLVAVPIQSPETSLTPQLPPQFSEHAGDWTRAQYGELTATNSWTALDQEDSELGAAKNAVTQPPAGPGTTVTTVPSLSEGPDGIPIGPNEAPTSGTPVGSGGVGVSSPPEPGPDGTPTPLPADESGEGGGGVPDGPPPPPARPTTNLPPGATPRPGDRVPLPDTVPPGGGIGGTGAGSGSGILNQIINGALQGAARALLGQALGQQQSQAPTCPTDPQAMQQYQQQYQMQVQQYQYQMQQYQYQQQLDQYYARLYGQNPNSTYSPAGYYGGYPVYNSDPYGSSYGGGYGYGNPGQIPPRPPQPCVPGSGSTAATGTGVGGTTIGGGTATGECQVLPAQPSPTLCVAGTWQQKTTTLSNGRVCPIWSCTPTPVPPTAQISCNPKQAEKGMKVAIVWNCSGATASRGLGFDSAGRLSGAIDITLSDVPENAASAKYGIACTNQSLGTTTECAVEIVWPRISLRVDPPAVPEGQTTVIGWTTTGMRSCVISSEEQLDFTRRNASATSTTGIATSSPIIEETHFALNCITLTGGTRAATATVGMMLATTTGSVASGFDGLSGVPYGATTTIEWAFETSATNTAVALWLYDIQAQQVAALIHGPASTTGQYVWQLPQAGGTCTSGSPLVCAQHFAVGRTYGIVAEAYRPHNAYLGGTRPAGAPDKTVIGRSFTERPFRFGQ